MRRLHERALFAGAGGGILGGMLHNWRTICAVEIDPYCREVLLQRQEEGLLEEFPIWDDVRTFDGQPWQGHIDIISGGFPCQDISSAGKGAGLEGERSGLWKDFARIIGEVRPRYVFVENSPRLTGLGLDQVLGDLASMGFDAEWCVLGAADAGAPHLRERIWILAHAQRFRPHPTQDQRIMEGEGACELRSVESRDYWGDWWATEPALGRVAHGVAHRVDRLRAIGNGQVPAVAALAFELLMERLNA